MPGCNTGTNTIFFIHKHQVPKDRVRDIIYGLITVLICLEKIIEPIRTTLVAGGDRVNYPGDMPEDMITQYNLRQKATTNGYVYTARSGRGSTFVKKLLNMECFGPTIFTAPSA